MDTTWEGLNVSAVLILLLQNKIVRRKRRTETNPCMCVRVVCEVFVKCECCSGAFDTCMHELICSDFLPFSLSSLDEPGAHTYSNATAVIRRPSGGASMTVAKLARRVM